MERNKDLRIIPSNNNYPRGKVYLYDLDFDEDLELVEGRESVENGVIVAILTHYNELSKMPLYKEFGSKVHELIKESVDELSIFKLEQYIKESVLNMRRVQSVDKVKVKSESTGQYYVYLEITDIDGNLQTVEV